MARQSYVLRDKFPNLGDRYSFYEYTIYNCKRTGRLLNPPEIGWEKLKYAEEFTTIEEALKCKFEVDPEDILLEIVNMSSAEKGKISVSMEEPTEEEKRDRILHFNVQMPVIEHYVQIEGTFNYDEEDTDGTCVDTERD